MTRSDTTRVFLAVPLPEELGTSLDRLRKELESEVRGAKWVEPKNFHITMAFLGDVPDEDLERLGRAVSGAVSGFERFSLRVESVGTFPSASMPRTLWIGVGGTGVPALVALQASVAEAAALAGYSGGEAGSFHPHVTLARFKSRPARGRTTRPPDLSPLVDRLATYVAGTFWVDEVVVFASRLRPEGPEYSRIAAGSLRGHDQA